MRLRHVLPLLLVAACGEVITVDSDAAVDAPDQTDAAVEVDGPIDGPEEPTGPIRVTVLAAGVPVAGASVVASDGGGTRSVVTGADGKATIEGRAGASVTAIIRVGKVASITTIAGAKPGDDLLFGDRRVPPTSPGAMTVKFKAFPGPGTVSTYRVDNSCRTRTTLSTVFEASLDYLGCDISSATVHIAALDSTGVLLGSTSRFASFTAGGIIDATTATWKPALPLSARFTQVPFQASSLVLRRWVGPPARQFQLATVRVDQPNATQVASLKYPDVAGQTTMVTVLTGETRQTQVFGEVLPAAATYEMSFENLPLPWISTLAANAATRTVSWTETTGAAPDGGIATLTYDIGDNDVTWKVIGPAGTVSATQVDLPAEHDAIELGAAAAAKTLVVRRFDFPEKDGYDTFRTTAEPDDLELGNFDLNGDLGKRTKLRMSEATARFSTPSPK